MSFLYSVAGFLLAISILVAVHEFGHYWAARRLGVKVLKFSIGFGKPLWSRTLGADQTEYRIAAIPLGGYVQMLGEGDPNSPIDPREAHRSFDAQPIWKRSIIAAAGPAINFVFAAILFMALSLVPEAQFKPVFGSLPANSKLAEMGVKSGDRLLAVDGKQVAHLSEYNLYIFNQVLKGKPIEFTISSENDDQVAALTDAGSAATRTLQVVTKDIPLYDINPASLVYQVGLLPLLPSADTTLGSVLDGSPADSAGLQTGDRIVRINGSTVTAWNELTALIAPNANQAIEVAFDRAGVISEILLVPELAGEGAMARGVIGVGQVRPVLGENELVHVSHSLPQALTNGVAQTWLISALTVRMLGKMITLQVSPKNVNGPITIADVAGQTIQIDWQAYLQFLAVISISLGIMNLLPIPMLDGGHLMMFAVEAVAGRNASHQFYAAGQRVGIVLLIGLMSLAFYNDILRILN